MFSPEIEKLIKIALIDGVITEKERLVLIRKATAEGLDPDEFEMMLEAYLFEKQSTIQEPPPIPEQKKDIERCPSCNDALPQFSTHCRSCGMELSEAIIPAAIAELLTKLKEIELNGNKRNSALLSAFSDSPNEGSEVKQQKCDLISNFIVPLNKAEILGFLSIAIPHARKAIGNKSFMQKLLGGNEEPDKLAEAWKIKCEQIIVQARFAMKEDSKTLKEINEYATELKIN
jgi:hypothetical protein